MSRSRSSGITVFVYGIVRGGDIGWGSSEVWRPSPPGSPAHRVPRLGAAGAQPDPRSDAVPKALRSRRGGGDRARVPGLHGPGLLPVLLPAIRARVLASEDRPAARSRSPPVSSSSPRAAPAWCSESARAWPPPVGLLLMTVAFVYYTTARCALVDLGARGGPVPRGRRHRQRDAAVDLGDHGLRPAREGRAGLGHRQHDAPARWRARRGRPGLDPELGLPERGDPQAGARPRIGSQFLRP